MSNTYIIIMAGGTGTRFWPYSRIKKPKQFLDILGTGRTMIQSTYERFRNLAPPENFMVVTNEEYTDLVKEQLPELTDDQIIKEPVKRNTAPCIACATYKIMQKNSDAVTVVTPSDHIVQNDLAFVETMKEALEFADEKEHLVTIGIKPHRPETGYGYIQFLDGDEHIKKVKTFTEKPEKDLAKTFLASGDFLWNSGVFVWKANTIRKNFEKHLPEVDEIFSEIESSFYSNEENEAIKKAYSQCRSISIDYGIMEKARNVFVVPGDFGWSDVGSWETIHELSPQKDENKNVVQANALLYSSKNCLIRASKDKLIVIQDLNGYLVTEYDNVILVCKKDAEKKFREFVADVKEHKGTEYL